MQATHEEEELAIQEERQQPQKTFKSFILFLWEKAKQFQNPRFPNFVFIVLGIIWGFYIKFGSGDTKASDKYCFVVVKNWPSCKRINEPWRIETYQFIHNDFEHIFYNSLGFVIYGTILENVIQFENRLLFTLIIHYCGVAYSAITYYYMFPYNSVVGASGGMYSIIGSLSSSIVLYNQNAFLKFVYGSFITIDLIIEIVLYFVAHRPNIAYGAHAGGFIFGFLFTLAFSPRKGILWKRLIGGMAFILLVIYTCLIVNNYVNVWPPQPNWNPTLYKRYQPLDLCGKMYLGN